MRGNRSNKHLGNSTLFGLLRHGVTLWNEEKRIQGSGNSPLSKDGESQTKKWSLYLKQYNWDRILASDLGRVRQTVSLLNNHLALPVTWDSNLREINWGEWEGLKLEDVKRRHGKELSRQTDAGWGFRAPQGESRREALQRARKSIHNGATTWPGHNILVVCHLGIIKCILYDILGKKFHPSEKQHLEKNGLHLIRLTATSSAVEHLNILPGQPQ